ncbi:MAG: hypothetical protein JWL90_4181 [Chthoniobacteraceae bacterium]|nr:hypothetical protein [Chthoniobacteraceae bacterium]
MVLGAGAETDSCNSKSEDCEVFHINVLFSFLSPEGASVDHADLRNSHNVFPA